MRTLPILVSSLVLGALISFSAVSNIAAQDHATPVATEFAELPEAAIGPAIPESGYLVEEIADGLYWVTEGSYQAMFLTTGEGVVLVDAPASLAGILQQAIADVTDEAVTHFVYSHHHADHVGAAGLFADTATYIGHEATAELLTRSADENRPVPTEMFADSMTLEVGSQTLQLEYHGNNHEPGNIFIHAPAQKVLMVVDIVFPGWVPFGGLGLAEDVPGFIAAHDIILGYDFDTFVGGHLTRLGTREDVEIAQEFILDVQANAGAALQAVDFMAIAGTVGFENQWLLFDTYLGAVAQHCADATIPNWVDRLGGADVLTYSHCWMMVGSLRTD